MSIKNDGLAADRSDDDVSVFISGDVRGFSETDVMYGIVFFDIWNYIINRIGNNSGLHQLIEWLIKKKKKNIKLVSMTNRLTNDDLFVIFCKRKNKFWKSHHEF